MRASSYVALSLASVLVVGCATPPPPPPPPPRDPVITHDFLVAARAPDIAAYPALREHVWVPASPDRQFVVVRVINFQKAKPVPAPVYQIAAASGDPKPAFVPTPAPAHYEAVVRFAFDKSNLDAVARAALQSLLDQIGAARGLSYVVDAHTDSVGAPAYNDRLSAMRAKAVSDFLVQAGVSPSAISAVPHGMRDPAASNATAQGRSENRRATVTVEGK